MNSHWDIAIWKLPYVSPVMWMVHIERVNVWRKFCFFILFWWDFLDFLLNILRSNCYKIYGYFDKFSSILTDMAFHSIIRRWKNKQLNQKFGRFLKNHLPSKFEMKKWGCRFPYDFLRIKRLFSYKNFSYRKLPGIQSMTIVFL